MEKEITGIILAGGKNSRMGMNKAFLPVAGKKIIDILVEALRDQYGKVVVVTNQFKEYVHLGVPLFSDIIRDKNALGGLYTGLIHSSSTHNFVCACDMPFINRALTDYMAEYREEYDVVIPEFNGMLQPLCAFYSQQCIGPIADALACDDRAIISILNRVTVKIIEHKEVCLFDLQGLSFINLNDPLVYDTFKNGVPAAYAAHA